MKKFFVITMLIIIGFGSLFAAGDGNEGTLPSFSKANLQLNLDEDKYLLGFSAGPNYTSMGATAVALKETVADNFSVTIVGTDTNNNFYMFYKALTDSATVKLTLTIDSPLYYYDGSDLTNGAYDYETINYKASLTADTDWDAEDIDGTIYSKEEAGKYSSVTVGIRGSSTNTYLTKGICKISISSIEGDDLSSKVPGVYKSTMTLTLAST